MNLNKEESNCKERNKKKKDKEDNNCNKKHKEKE